MCLSIVSHLKYDESLLEGFRHIYMASFPDIDEREPYDNIKERISGSSSDPGTIACLFTVSGKVAGGLITDYYVFKESQSFDIEIIYIAVDSGFRRNGYGKQLMTKGLKSSISELEKLTGQKLRNIYFETENPFKARDLSFDPISRLRFFTSLGALRVPIEYRQPPLDKSSGWTDNLFLMILPKPEAARADAIDKNELDDFLTAFYRGLSVSDSSCYEAFRKEIDRIAEVNGGSGYGKIKRTVKLDTLIEEPSFQIEDTSILLHFNMKGCRFTGEDESDIKACNVFESYECDLMDYAHQERSRRPFRTYHIHSFDNVELGLPTFYQYTSEGHTFYRLTAATSLKADISLNCSSRGKEVNEDERYVFSLVIRPTEGQRFDDLSIIKLITLFGSRQENYFAFPDNNYADLCLTVSGEEKPVSLFEFMSRTLTLYCDGLTGTPDFECWHSGATEIELSSIRKNEDGKELFSGYAEFYESIVSSSPEESLWNKTLCGILLGIFDFERMNSAEIYDTIKPIVNRGSSFMLMNRGHLLKLSYAQGRERIDNIFISPYLMIPDVALVFNEMTLDNCKASLSLIDSTDTGKISSYFEKVKTDAADLHTILHALNSKYIPNCFNYSSEEEIYSAGVHQRRLDIRRSRLISDIELKQSEVELRKSRFALLMDTIQSIFLIILAILQVYVAVNKFHWIFYIVLGLTVLVGVDFASKKLKS